MDDTLDDFQETMPGVAPWIAASPETTRSNDIWAIRCASRMIGLRRELRFDEAYGVARTLCGDALLRGRAPELVAEDMVRSACDPA